MQRDSHQQASLVPPKAPSTWGKQLKKGLQQPFGLKLIWRLGVVANTLNRGPREVEAGRTDMVHSQPWAMTGPCLGGGINLNQPIFLSFLSSFPLTESPVATVESSLLWDQWWLYLPDFLPSSPSSGVAGLYNAGDGIQGFVGFCFVLFAKCFGSWMRHIINPDWSSEEQKYPRWVPKIVR